MGFASAQPILRAAAANAADSAARRQSKHNHAALRAVDVCRGRGNVGTAATESTLDHQASIKDWLGHTRRDDDEVVLGAVQRLAATLDQDPHAFKRGAQLPESWYAILFGTTAKESDLGADGHPVTGDFMPPMQGTRRMFAGRRSTFHRPLKIGDTVSRLSTVTRVEPKSGRTGAFTLVTVVHEMSAPSGLAITEEQDIVYRAAVEAGTTEAPKEAPRVTEAAEWSRALVLDTVLLFRYSALVMNGGLTALLLVETARPHFMRPIAGYAARAIRPLFVGERVTFNVRRTADGAMLWASGPDGGLNYRVDVTLAS
jgi:3-methylfumaryl-CoA hydratase